MCGIAGFSLTPNSKVKTRQLANAMLTAIEDRGYMASGFAYSHDGAMGYHSAPQPGSSLPLKFLPRKARTVILHTRLATHGSVHDNRNNHPVISPDGNIALVHNGGIYNHHDVRTTISCKLPDVDTSVIPATIEEHGIESLKKLDGDAAIAWLDRRDPDTLHLARYQHSPLVVAHIEDGSFVFASTEQLLWRVLVQLDLMPTWMHSPNELDYYTIKHGIINSTQMLPEPVYSGSAYDYNYYRHQTSGAKGTAMSGYEWDEWDEDYDYPKALGTPEDSSSPTHAFWTEIKDELAHSSDYIYYEEHERDLWVNELYYIANDPGVSLLDYGNLTKSGDLVSTKHTVSDVF